MRPVVAHARTIRPTISFTANITSCTEEFIKALNLNGQEDYIYIFEGDENDEYPLYVARSEANAPNSEQGIYKVNANKNNYTIKPHSISSIMRAKNIARVVITTDTITHEGITFYGCSVDSKVASNKKEEQENYQVNQNNNV